MSQELADRLHSAAIHLLRRVATVDAGSGLSPARLSALSVIVYGGPLTMSALARAERVSPATISSTVSGLESAGLVARRRDGTDARSVTVEATARGRYWPRRWTVCRPRTVPRWPAGWTRWRSCSAIRRTRGAV